MTPAISIVTPCLNAAPYLAECLASVRQAGELAEHLVMDGGSMDGTLEILSGQSYALWSSGSDAGQSDAINRGLARSRGEFLGYLCADDLLEPGWAEAVLGAFGSGADVVYGDGWFLEGSSGWKRLKRVGVFSYARLRRGNFLIQPAVFFRRSVYEKFGGFDVSLHFCMDHEYWLRIGEGTRWQHAGQALATCRLHPEAKTSKHLARAWDEAARMQARYGLRWKPRLDALWMRLGGARYYLLKRRFFAAVGARMVRGS